MAFRILIVEDDAHENAGVRDAVSILGWEIAGIAKNGRDAADLAVKTRPDLALIHMNLVASDEGFRLSRELRIDHHLPVILLGAFSSEEILERASWSGCIAYLVEPLRTDELDAVARTAHHQDLAAFSAFVNHDWLAAMFDSLSDGVIATGVDGSIQFMNPAAQALTGWIPFDAIGKPIDQIYSLSDIESGEFVKESQIRKVLSSRKPSGKQTFLLTTRTGGRIIVEDSATPILDGTALVGAVTIFTKIESWFNGVSSDQQQRPGSRTLILNKALGPNQSEINSLVGRLIDSQEDERRRLARELHDDLAQSTVHAALLVDRIANSGELLKAGNQKDLEQLKSTIAVLANGIRKVSHRLHPAILEDLGLPQALRSLVRDYRELGLDVAESVHDAPDVIPISTAVSLYRIAQEALRNILRHAPGAPAVISLKFGADHIEMRIEDAGPGFSLNREKHAPGLGLSSMQATGENYRGKLRA